MQEIQSTNQQTLTAENEQAAENKGVASLVLGIVGIVLSGPIGLVCGIIGLVMAKKAKALSGGKLSGLAMAGFICSIVATVLGGLWTLFLTLYLGLYAFVLFAAILSSTMYI